MKSFRASVLLSLLALGVVSPALADVWQARYGVAEIFNFKLYNADGTLDVDEADGGTEVSVSCNEGAETTATNDFVDEGTFYSISLTSGEMSCERIAVVVAATTTEVFFIQTTDHASAFTPSFLQTGDSFARLGAPAGASVSADVAAIEAQTDDIGAAGVGLTAVGVGAISGDTAAADTLETWLDGTAGAASPLGIARQGTAQSATGTTIVLDSGASFADDTAIGMTVVACGSTQGYCQSRAVTDYVLTTDTATVETWTVTPSGTITYYLFATAPGAAGGGLDAAGVRAAVGLASANLDAQLGAIDDYVDTEVAAILVDTGTTLDARIPAALVSGRMDVSVGAMAANVVTAAAAAADLTTELQSGLATAAALTTVDDFLDTEVAAIKAKTDQLTFGVTNQLDVNVESMNTNAMCGTGDAGTPWTGCP